MKKLVLALSFLLFSACGPEAPEDATYEFSATKSNKTEYSSTNAFGHTLRVQIFRSVSDSDITPVSPDDMAGATYIRLYVPRRLLGKSATVTKVATCGCPGQREVVTMRQDWKDHWAADYFQAEFTKPLVQTKKYRFIFTIGNETHVLNFQ